jgi:hypothetical protein
MCNVLLPPGVNTIAVNKYIIYHIISNFLSMINPVDVLKYSFFICFEISSSTYRQMGKSVVSFRPWEQCLLRHFSSLWRLLLSPIFRNGFVYIVLLRTILSACVTLAGEAYELVARPAHEYNGTPSSSFYVPVTAFSYSWHQRPTPSTVSISHSFKLA